MGWLTRVRAAGLVVLVGLLLAAIPAQAAIGLMDPRTPPFAMLDEAEFAKLKELSVIRPAVPGSPISPDETTVLAGVGDQVGFLDIRDGSLRPINLAALSQIRRLTNFSWRGPNTLVYVGVDLGRRVAVVVSLNSATGAATARPVALPGAPLSSLPALSPDGNRLLVGIVRDTARPAGAIETDAFTSPFSEVVPLGLGWPAGFDDEEPTLRLAAIQVTLLVVELGSGEVTPIGTLPPNTSLAAMSWSGDGRRLALSRFNFDQDDIRSPVRSIVNLEAQGALPPDQNPVLQTNVVDLIDLASGQVRPAVLRATGVEGGLIGDVELSPDGSVLTAMVFAPTRLAGRAHPTYLFSERASFRFYSFEGQPLGALADRLIETPFSAWTMISNDELVGSTVIGSDLAVVHVNRATNTVSRAALPAGVAGALRIAPRSRQLVFVRTSFVQAPEIFRSNLDGSALAALTYVNTELGQRSQIRVDEVSFTLANGQQRTGYLLQPAGAAFPPRNVPIVVWQEGGPFSSMLNLFATNVEHPFNLLPNFGMAVLVVPLVGRFGFGVERFRALYDGDNFGRIDIDEQAEIVGQLVERGWTARGKVGITGCSYGGYFAAQSIARHPEVYAAANPQCTLLDLYNEWGFGTRSVAVSFMMGAPPTVKTAAYAEASPLYGAGRARAATLFFHGTEDFLPVQLVAAMHDQVQTNGGAANMLAFLGEPHGLLHPNSQLMAAQWQIRWFRDYLK